MLKLNNIYNLDCLKGMKKLSENSVDLIVSDPPYGYSFMSRDWDKSVPSVEIWKECLRVLKPGAFAFIMSAPRQDVQAQMIFNLKDAGFELKFTPMYWTYATGFPKAMDIGKMVDKRLGAKRIVVGKGRIGIKKAFDSGQWGTGSETVNITLPSTSKAKSLDGSYSSFQPKPAVEIILVVMKPLSEKTFVDQALKNGKGITWLDDCRVPYLSQRDRKNTEWKGERGFGTHNAVTFEGKGTAPKIFIGDPQGRFPANLLVSDDVLNDGREKVCKPHKGDGKVLDTENMGRGFKRMSCNISDLGSFSRYFSLDAWWEECIRKFPDNVKKTYPFLIVPKASRSEKNVGCEELDSEFMDKKRKVGSAGGCNPRNRGAENPKKNYHPTVKPIKLMSYLVTLGSREKDVVLDPFMGSGTTAIACKQLKRNYIGFESDKGYCKIAKKRLENLNIKI